MGVILAGKFAAAKDMGVGDFGALIHKTYANSGIGDETFLLNRVWNYFNGFSIGTN